MKIIVVTENGLQNNKMPVSSLNDKEPIVMFKADSSWLKGGKPLFLPDDKGTCSAGLHLVARICRLGKTIPRRFASRYYDSITLGMDVRADEVVERLGKAGLPWDEGVSFDGASVTGRFVPQTESSDNGLTVKLTVDGISVVEVDVEGWRLKVDELIESISQWISLREGDLLYCGEVAERMPLGINQHLHAELNGEALLDFNVK